MLDLPLKVHIVQVEKTREAQVELRDQIDVLAGELKKISEQQASPIDLGTYYCFILLLA